RLGRLATTDRVAQLPQPLTQLVAGGSDLSQLPPPRIALGDQAGKQLPPATPTRPPLRNNLAPPSGKLDDLRASDRLLALNVLLGAGDAVRSSYTSRSASSPDRTKRVTVCKTVYPGSIPGVASKEINDLAQACRGRKFFGSFSVAWPVREAAGSRRHI